MCSISDGGTPIPASAITKTIYGIVGVIKLIAGEYFVLTVYLYTTFIGFRHWLL